MSFTARFWSFVLGVLMACTTAESMVLAAPAPDRPDSVGFPDGVADAAGKTAYVANAAGGIDAIDLAKGELLWDTKEATKPLALLGDKLLAQTPVKDKANQLRIIVLDTGKKGKKVLESDAVVFPEWVAVGAMGQGSSLISRGRGEKGDLFLIWDAHTRYYGGAAPTPEILERAKKDASGIARINVESGKVVMLDKEKLPDFGPKIPKELEKVTSQQYWTGSDWLTKPVVAGDKVAALAVKQNGDKQTMTLKRWELSSGKELEEKELLQGKALWPQMGLDGKHLFVHQALVKEQLPEGDFAWWVFNLETGERVAKLPHETLQSPVVLGSRLYYSYAKPMKGGINPGFGEQERAVRAVDLKTGKVEWERALAGIKFYPPPP